MLLGRGRTCTAVAGLKVHGSGARAARAGARAGCSLLLIQLLLPLLLYAIKRPNVYDGLRHFLFLLPAIALCAAVGIRFSRHVPRHIFDWLVQVLAAAGAIKLFF